MRKRRGERPGRGGDRKKKRKNVGFTRKRRGEKHKGASTLRAGGWGLRNREGLTENVEKKAATPLREIRRGSKRGCRGGDLKGGWVGLVSSHAESRKRREGNRRSLSIQGAGEDWEKG